MLENIKKALKHTWKVFFGYFPRLYPIQEKTIPLVLSGKNLLIISPTASGKTEAVVAPLIERYISEDWDNLAILYISPTRALVNDLFFRLKEQLEYLGLSVGMKTRDRVMLNLKQPPAVLFTTPESFDSLLARHSDLLKAVRAVIIDELHILDGTYRGDQLRILLKRLDGVTETQPNVYIMSATISDPKGLAERYLRREYEIIEDKRKRPIDYHLFPSLEEAFQKAREENLRKVLVFCNSRRRVEEVAKEAGRLWGEEIVVAHHGSLSKKVRQEAESFMRVSKVGVCVATSTLEVGIDIGDIDVVILAEPPWSVSSLIQRIGRGGRKRKVIKAIGIFSNEGERALLELMFERAKRGELLSQPYRPDLSVAIQQIFSILVGTPQGVKSEVLYPLFEWFCEAKVLDEILVYLKGKGFLEFLRGKWFATSKLMDLGYKGNVHSNIPSSGSFKVIDVTSDRIIGKVILPVDKFFSLAGRIWEVVDIKYENFKVLVKGRKSAKGLPPTFPSYSSVGAFYNLLPPSLRREKAPETIRGLSSGYLE